jgi:hypothetical protein
MNFNETVSHVCDGEVEIIIKDVHGRVIDSTRTKNIIKIGAKEILAHRLPFTKIWDPYAGSGSGAWVAASTDYDDFAPKYILLGASFDTDGAPLDKMDTRYYKIDSVTGSTVPITLGVGAEYCGGLINAIPLCEPSRPLKKIERIYFEPSYQPAGTPYMQDDVRAMNNIVVLETTLTKEEYNGFSTTPSDYFTIAEVALAAGRTIDTTSCDCDPKVLFLEGKLYDSTVAITAVSNNTSTITIDPIDSASYDVIKEGDQVKVVDAPGTGSISTTGQVSDHYLVIDKVAGSGSITLDRPIMDSDNNPIVGSIGIFKDSLRIFSHRILMQPFKKSSDFMITIRWRIIMN